MPAPEQRSPSPRGLIWLVGMMGSGKSTVGRRLAERLGRPFVDMDAAIEREAGRSVNELFAVEGEAAFRDRERALVARIVADGTGAVVATGGGAPCVPGVFAAMQRSGIVAWLAVEVDEVLARLDVGKRPLLAGERPRETWLGLAARREATYALADLRVDRGARDSDAVADEIARWLADWGEAPLGLDEVPSLTVELGARSYPIRIDPRANAAERFAAHLARKAPPGRATIGVVTDENVARLHLPRFRAALHKRGFRAVEVVVPAGEGSKSIEQAGRIADALVSGGLDRRSTVVALGGGVVGDLAGFVASILFRGVALVQAPTTLLAMVDSSVGGKTGVNLPAGKNLAGTFHQPLLVYADLSTLRTLPPRDLSAGLGEVAKHALLDGDGALLGRLEAEAERARAGEPELLAELVRASCAIKARVVAGDERETAADGGRALLNLGHTVGHALETHSHRVDDDPLRHGEAVALGLVAAARIGRALATDDGGADPGLEARVVSLLARLGLPTDLDARLADDALAAIAVDKKRAGGPTKPVVRYIALPRAGAPRIVSVEPARIAALLSSTNALPQRTLSSSPEVGP